MAEVKQSPGIVNVTVIPPGDDFIMDIEFPFNISEYTFDALLTLADLKTTHIPTQEISLVDDRLSLTFPGVVAGAHSWWLKLTKSGEPPRTWFSGTYTVKSS